MTKLILTGDLNNAQLGFQQGWGYGMLALGIGGFANKFPTPNADLNSNNLMAALTRDGVSNALLSSWNPYAMMAGAAVKVIDKTGGFSNVSEGLGTGNDIGNMFMSFIPGPGWFTKPTTKYEMSADMQVMGSGYLGSLKDALTAENNAGAKLLFGRGKANRMITDAQFRDLQISNIKALRDIDFLTARSMTLNKAMSNQYALLGSYNQSYARVGKFGLKLERAKQLAIKFKEPTNIKELQEVIAMKDGGKFFLDLIAQVDNKPVIDNDTEFFDSLIQSLQDGGKINKNLQKPETFEEFVTLLPKEEDLNLYNWRRAFELAPWEDIRNFLMDPKNNHMRDFYWNEETGEGEFMKRKDYPHLYDYSENPDDALGEIGWYKSNNKDAVKFREEYDLDESGEYPKYVKKHKEGGLMNVIPEGSLHARLHHMENADNLTKKGIPVVDNNGNQLAEIEHSEIIFTKEVTEKLEELYKKFKSDEYTNKEKEGFAIEAGKLLSKEIIENTDDRVGLLNADKFAEGGIFELPELSSVPPTPAPIYTGELWFRKGFEALTTKYPAQLSLYIMRHAASEGNNKTGYYQLGMNGGNTKNTRKSTDPNSMITYAAELINKYGGIKKFNAVKTWADYLNLLFRPDFMYNEEYSFNPKYSPGKANSYRVNGLIPNEAIDAYKRGYNLNNFVRSLSGPYTSINTWVTNLVNEYNQNNPKNPISNINYTL